MGAEDKSYEVEPLQPTAYYQPDRQGASAQVMDQPPELTFRNIINARGMIFRAFTSGKAFREFLSDERIGPHAHLLLMMLIIIIMAVVFSIIIAVG